MVSCVAVQEMKNILMVTATNKTLAEATRGFLACSLKFSSRVYKQNKNPHQNREHFKKYKMFSKTGRSYVDGFRVAVAWDGPMPVRYRTESPDASGSLSTDRSLERRILLFLSPRSKQRRSDGGIKI